mmetsp:Transcript_7493/g.17154  ORF Transcript_7493/g.17154 Transcript_7493/m.17154 type:complete len:210 (+) Transcript_7493:317-946(+)
MHSRDLWMKSAIAKAKTGAGVFQLEARAALEEEATYQGALDRLRSTKLMTPQYHIIAGAGPYEGAVITVDVGLTFEPSTYRYRSLSKTDWYLVQTNDDWGFLSIDKRRSTASDFIFWKGQELINLPAQKGVTAFEQVMRLWPVCNDYTIYTWYMSAATGMDYVVDELCTQKVGTFRRRQELTDKVVMPDSNVDLPDVTPLFSKMSNYVF